MKTPLSADLSPLSYSAGILLAAIVAFVLPAEPAKSRPAVRAEPAVRSFLERSADFSLLADRLIRERRQFTVAARP